MDFPEWKDSLTDEQKSAINKYVDNSDKHGIIKSSKKVRATEIEEKRSTIRTGSSLWSKEQLDELIRTENEIIKNPYETAVVYSKNGNMIFYKVGSSEKVTFTKKEIKKMKNGVLTHNHPDNSMLSINDFHILKIGKFSEIRALTTDCVYMFRNVEPNLFKDIEYKELLSRFYEIDEEISKKYLEIAAQNGRTILHYDAEIYERTVEKLCEEFRVELSKEYRND